MRADASIVHVDLDAFFASVEQRDKPSLRSKPVIVGGAGLRGVVSTASYEARAYGARSAMSTAEARAICPRGTAFLWPRFEAYRKSSLAVMELLREVTPLVEQVSIDEAYLDLRGSDLSDLSPSSVQDRLRRLAQDIEEATGGLTASAAAASSKMLAKIGSDLRKPNGIVVVAPGEEQTTLDLMSVRAISGVGPATESRLKTFGVETVADLRRMDQGDLISIFGDRHGRGLYALARAQDDRELTLEREAKSISNEETFERDVHELPVLRREIERIAESVAARLEASSVFGRTVHLKVRLPDFTALTRSSTLAIATREANTITRAASRLLDGLDLPQGVRLVGVGVSGFVHHSQDSLFTLEHEDVDSLPEYPDTFIPGDASRDDASRATSGADPHALSTRFSPSGKDIWRTGMDVIHAVHGPGWVWGAGNHRVTVRFEGPQTGPGPIRSFRPDDADLAPAPPPEWKDDAGPASPIKDHQEE